MEKATSELMSEKLGNRNWESCCWSWVMVDTGEEQRDDCQSLVMGGSGVTGRVRTTSSSLVLLQRSLQAGETVLSCSSASLCVLQR